MTFARRLTTAALAALVAAGAAPAHADDDLAVFRGRVIERSCPDARGGGLLFQRIRSENMPCRKARRFAAVHLPRAYHCEYAWTRGPARRPTYAFRCTREAPYRSLAFIVR